MWFFPFCIFSAIFLYCTRYNSIIMCLFIAFVQVGLSSFLLTLVCTHFPIEWMSLSRIKHSVKSIFNFPYINNFGLFFSHSVSYSLPHCPLIQVCITRRILIVQTNNERTTRKPFKIFLINFCFVSSTLHNVTAEVIWNWIRLCTRMNEIAQLEVESMLLYIYSMNICYLGDYFWAASFSPSKCIIFILSFIIMKRSTLCSFCYFFSFFLFFF